jgi:hypothetical protein
VTLPKTGLSPIGTVGRLGVKQQNGLDSSCKAALSFWFGFVGSLVLFSSSGFGRSVSCSL